MNFLFISFSLVGIFFLYFAHSPNKFSNGLFFMLWFKYFILGSNIYFIIIILFYLFFWLNLLSSTTIPKDKGKHTVEALMSGQAQDVKKESVTGAGRL